MKRTNMCPPESNVLSLYDPISLEEMSRVGLMNRIDTKFLTTWPVAECLLQMASENYCVQEMSGLRMLPYSTRYYDTPDCRMFFDHQCGRTPRRKVRIRRYEINDIAYLEVKSKNNKGRTSKKRTPFYGHDDDLSPYFSFLEKHDVHAPQELRSQIENHFSRITLVNRSLTERLTLDTGLQFHNLTTGRVHVLDELVVIELKRDGLQPSPVLEMLRLLHIHPAGFSKYCMGMAMTNEYLKQNRFKPRIHDIVRLCSSPIPSQTPNLVYYG